MSVERHLIEGFAVIYTLQVYVANMAQYVLHVRLDIIGMSEQSGWSDSQTQTRVPEGRRVRHMYFVVR